MTEQRIEFYTNARALACVMHLAWQSGNFELAAWETFIGTLAKSYALGGSEIQSLVAVYRYYKTTEPNTEPEYINWSDPANTFGAIT